MKNNYMLNMRDQGSKNPRGGVLVRLRKLEGWYPVREYDLKKISSQSFGSYSNTRFIVSNYELGQS